MRHHLKAVLWVSLGLAVSSGPAWAAPAMCPELRWITLGTAGGPVPTPERSEPANLLIAGQQVVLVDTGDGTVNQLARVDRDLRAVSTVFISHHHHDHTGGLAAVIGLRWMNQFAGVLTVYGPPGTRQIVDGIVQSLQPQARVGFGLGVASQPPGETVRVVELRDGDRVAVGDLAVQAAANSHFDHRESHTPDAPQSLSYRFSLGPRAITYTGDTGPSAAVTALARGSDLLVSEVIDLAAILRSIRATRSDAPAEVLAQMERHLAAHHLAPAEIGRIAAAAGVGHVVLTHFAIPPGPLERSEPALRAGIADAYRGPVDLARDLAGFSIGCTP